MPIFENNTETCKCMISASKLLFSRGTHTLDFSKKKTTNAVPFAIGNGYVPKILRCLIESHRLIDAIGIANPSAFSTYMSSLGPFGKCYYHYVTFTK